jgi:chaperonin GroEL (HSP60 family)
MADQVVKAGANVVLCQKGIADAVQYYLAKEGIMAIEDVLRRTCSLPPGP